MIEFAFRRPDVGHGWVLLRDDVARRPGPWHRDPAPDHRSRSAAVTGSLVARIAGGRPPARPMRSAKPSPRPRRSGVTWNANDRCENVWKFRVEVVRPFRGRTARQPTSPPTSETKSDSRTKDTITLPPPKPRARRVAISRVRSATAEYIVFRAANTAPSPITTATMDPRLRMKPV